MSSPEVVVPTAIHLPTPAELGAMLPVTPAVAAHVAAARQAIAAILAGTDRRLLVVVGPCSIHDVAAAVEYGHWLRALRDRFDERLLLVMRAYVEKARTGPGWKGLVNDPHLDGSGRIDQGLRLARELFVTLNELGLPVATEFIDPKVPAYTSDLVSWSAVGARTVESQVHREMASALPFPVGFKNGTGGSTLTAINAMVVARAPQQFLAIDRDGRVAMRASPGNAMPHLILRGGARPNHDAASIAQVAGDLRVRGLLPRVLVDCGHGNAGGDYGQQVAVGLAVAGQVARDREPIAGVMIESFLHAGSQPLVAGRPLQYGVSVTDGCLGRAETLTLLERLDDAAR